MTNFKAGLYKATVRGVPDQIVMLTDADQVDPWVSMLTTTSSAVHWRWHEARHIVAARPLIVLDIEFPREVASLLRRHNFTATAHQIEAQTKPARIEEPGLWGVVEANVLRGPRVKWLHAPAGWQSIEPVATRVGEWDDLIDPVLIREGLTP